MSNIKAPVSVLRKVGSSKCLQQDFYQNCENKDPEQSETKTVTLVNVEQLPPYSTERYYILSEIQMKAHSVQFLCDLVGNGNHDAADANSEEATQDLSTSSHSDNENTSNRTNERNQPQYYAQSQDLSRSPNLPPCVILYLLWRPESVYDTPSSYADNVIQPSIQHLMNLYQCSSNHDESNTANSATSHTNVNNKSKQPSIYIVVDRLVPKIENGMHIVQEHHGVTELDEAQQQQQLQQQEKYKKMQTEIAETLIRKISTDPKLKLRPIIQGITIGLSDNFRAAPGLEMCMDAILVGDSERRRFSSKKSNKVKTSTIDDTLNDHIWTMHEPKRSSIGLITEYADDLTGLDPEQETDAAQVDLNLHARCCGVWEGKGNMMNFAFLSQQIWKKFWDGGEEKDDDDYLLSVYSIIMGRCGNRKRRTGKRSRRSKKKSSAGINEDDNASQSKYLPSKTEQQNVEQTANFMIGIVLITIAYHIWTNYISDIIDLTRALILQGKEMIGIQEL